MNMNSRTIESVDSLTAWQVKFIYIHEFGHLLGLGHTSYGCGTAIMASDANVGNPSCSTTSPPWSDDIKGYHHIYG